MTPPSSQRIRVDTGLELHLLEWGRERPDLTHSVYLIHGFLDLAWGWEELVKAGFAEGLHVIAVDQRGHGDSDWVGAGGYYHFMDYVADLASLIRQTARGRVSLVGHSMGGSVASYYAGTYPDRVHKLALLEGLGPPEDEMPVPDRARHWIESIAPARSKAPRAYPSTQAAARRLQEHDSRLRHEFAERLAELGTRALANGSRVFKHDPLHVTRGPYPFRVDFARSFWQRVQCPVLLVEGSESPFSQLADREQRMAAFANARRQVIAGAGHLMQRHEPAALCRVLRDFLDGET